MLTNTRFTYTYQPTTNNHSSINTTVSQNHTNQTCLETLPPASVLSKPTEIIQNLTKTPLKTQITSTQHFYVHLCSSRVPLQKLAAESQCPRNSSVFTAGCSSHNAWLVQEVVSQTMRISTKLWWHNKDRVLQWKQRNNTSLADITTDTLPVIIMCLWKSTGAATRCNFFFLN